jgi:membrane associated rhomboid family serine protease
MFPISDTAPRASPATLVLTLIAVNTVVFLWMWSLPPRALDAVTVEYALIPLRYADPLGARAAGLDPDNWWPLLTNTFMHGGWLHLILNMWTLWIFGPAMEARFGRLGFTVLYLAGGVVASATHLIANYDSPVPALGASGAIATVIAAYAVIYPHARVLLIVPIGFIFIPLSAPAVLFALVWFGMQVLQGTQDLFSPSLAGGVAWWAHIGGFTFGALAALLVRGEDRGRRMAATTQWDARDFRNSRGRFPGPWSRD